MGVESENHNVPFGPAPPLGPTPQKHKPNKPPRSFTPPMPVKVAVTKIGTVV
jgi:hypothetical protein